MELETDLSWMNKNKSQSTTEKKHNQKKLPIPSLGGDWGSPSFAFLTTRARVKQFNSIERLTDDY